MRMRTSLFLKKFDSPAFVSLSAAALIFSVAGLVFGIRAFGYSNCSTMFPVDVEVVLRRKFAPIISTIAILQLISAFCGAAAALTYVYSFLYAFFGSFFLMICCYFVEPSALRIIVGGFFYCISLIIFSFSSVSYSSSVFFYIRLRTFSWRNMLCLFMRNILVVSFSLLMLFVSFLILLN